MQKLKTILSRPVGVIGAGSFGTTVAYLLSFNVDVLLYSRNEDTVKNINENHKWNDVKLSERIKATSEIRLLTESCHLIFPVVPSLNFADMMASFAPHLRPYHILIHGTKGFGLRGVAEDNIAKAKIDRKNIRTMSEIIMEESCVIRIGCLSGPNLSKEILDGQPAAAVIASRFEEVRQIGRLALDSKVFAVFGSEDIVGAELAGALKNVIALASGILGGLNLGKNIQSMLITRGLREMIYIGKALGAEPRAFLGTAGIGDLIATATSEKSRNYSFGLRLAQGESVSDILASQTELAEGVRTIKIVQQLALNYKLNIPIMAILYKIIYEDFKINNAIDVLMRFPYDMDVDFL